MQKKKKWNNVYVYKLQSINKSRMQHFYTTQFVQYLSGVSSFLYVHGMKNV